MINGKPTEAQLEEAQEVIDWIVTYTEINEPYAESFILAGKVFSEEMPTSPEGLEELYE